jgi:tetratricopeptide (TPR) repeat protein
MKLISSTAIALVAGLAATSAAAQYRPESPNNTMSGASPPGAPPTAATTEQSQAQAAAEPKVKLSGKASKAIIDLQTAVNANDTANIPAKLAAAQAVAQTKDDRYAIGILQRKAALAANDTTALAAAVEALANSGFLDSTKVSNLYLHLGVQQYNAKQYGPAVASFQKASSLNPSDAQALELLGQGLAAAGQKPEAVAAFQRAFQARAASGGKATEELYQRAVGAAYQAKLPSAVDLSRQWVAAYPNANSWHDAIAIYRNLNNPDPSNVIDLLRLARVTNSMKGTGDFHTYAFEASNQANYGEAKAVIAEGLSAGKIQASDPVIQDIQGVLKTKVAPTAAELATAEKGATVPTAFIRVGDRYYGAGNYQKAAELYGKALAKGADANLANLRVGEALAMAGDKAGASAALGKVGGSLADIAKLWLIYVQRQG